MECPGADWFRNSVWGIVILLLAVCAATALGTALWPEGTESLFFSVALFVLLLWWLRKAVPREERAYLTKVAVIAFALRLSCCYLVEALKLIESPDATHYHEIGARVAEYLRGGRFQEMYSWIITSAHPGYYFLVGVIYSIFGPNVWLARNLNVLISACTIFPIYFLSREVSPDLRIARLAVLAFAWLPNSVIWSTQLLKDSVIVLLEVMLILDLVRLLNRRFSTATILRLLATTVLLAKFRFYLPVLIYGSCAVAYVVMAWQARGGRRGSALAFLAVVLIIAVIGVRMTENFWSYYLKLSDWQRVEGFRVATTGGGSDFAADARIRSPEEVLSFLPIGTIYFLAGPLPWEAKKLTHYLTWLDIPIWYPVLALGSAGMLILLRRRQAIPLISITLGLTLFYSLFLANLGTAYRMRLQVTPFFMVAAAWYWYHSRERRSLARADSTHHL